jgi:hypothetical protein
MFEGAKSEGGAAIRESDRERKEQNQVIQLHHSIKGGITPPE